MADLNIPLVVLSTQEITPQHRTITFKKPQGFIYTPGDWMDIRFPTSEFPVGHTYSFASSTTEQNLMIAFKKGVSAFKKTLDKAKPGDTMLITQYGSNGFRLKKQYQSVLIAGGIGITPFRSMIKELVDTNSQTEIILIYENHTEDFPFKDELNIWQELYPFLMIHYVITGKEKRLIPTRLQQLLPHITKMKSYIAGSPSMVSNLENMLYTIGAIKENIKIDCFDGY